MGTHYDAAGLCLTENAGQPDDRNLFTLNDVAQHVAGTYTRQLVDVAHEDHAHGRGDGLHQVVHQDDVNHRTLVHNQCVPFQGILIVPLVAVFRIELQQPVNGLGLHAGGFAHTFGCPPRRSRQQNAESHMLQSRNDTLRSGRLTGTRSTRQYHHL